MKHLDDANIIIDGKPLKYNIKSDGTVYNNKSMHEMVQSYSINGYYIVRLSVSKYHRKEFFVHKLLATYFIDNPENKQFVHHIDKNRLNNSLSNLMWVTEEEHDKIHENEKHPFGRNENHFNAKLTNDQVHEICQYIQDNKYSLNQLADMYSVNRCVISEILNKGNWTDISSQYDFSNFNNYEWKKNDVEVIENICKEIMNNKLTIKQISEKLDVRDELVRRIYRKESFKEIVDKYDFSKNTVIKIRKIISKTELELLRKLVYDGKNNKEIIKIFNDNHYIITNNMIDSFRYREKCKINM